MRALYQNPPVECPAFKYEKEKGGFMLDPVVSDTHEGHYKTYLELDQSNKLEQVSTEFGNCSSCPNWLFSSVAERSRHR